MSLSGSIVVKGDLYKDGYCSITSEDFVPNTPCSSPEKIEDMLETIFKHPVSVGSVSLGFVKMTSKYYHRPQTNSSGARDIWIQCGLPAVETEYNIERALKSWGYMNGSIRFKDGVPHTIAWKNSGYKCSGSWAVFLKWFLFSCGGGYGS